MVIILKCIRKYISSESKLFYYTFLHSNFFDNNLFTFFNSIIMNHNKLLKFKCTNFDFDNALKRDFFSSKNKTIG